MVGDKVECTRNDCECKNRATPHEIRKRRQNFVGVNENKSDDLLSGVKLMENYTWFPCANREKRKMRPRLVVFRGDFHQLITVSCVTSPVHSNHRFCNQSVKLNMTNFSRKKSREFSFIYLNFHSSLSLFHSLRNGNFRSCRSVHGEKWKIVLCTQNFVNQRCGQQEANGAR